MPASPLAAGSRGSHTFRLLGRPVVVCRAVPLRLTPFGLARTLFGPLGLRGALPLGGGMLLLAPRVAGPLGVRRGLGVARVFGRRGLGLGGLDRGGPDLLGGGLLLLLVGLVVVAPRAVPLVLLDLFDDAGFGGDGGDLPVIGLRACSLQKECSQIMCHLLQDVRTRHHRGGGGGGGGET